MSYTDITAIILAAGQGTRLRPLTDDIPKCMVEVNGKPMLNRQLDILQSIGIENIIVVTGYEENKINDPRITKVFNEEYASTNKLYSLLCAEDYLEGNIIVTYGDIIYSEEILKKLVEDERDIVIASDEEWQNYWELRFEDPLTDAESFKKGENGKVQSLGKKAKSIEEIEGQFIGMVKLSQKGVESIKNEYHNCKDNALCRNNAWGSGRVLRKAYMTDLMNHFAHIGELYFNPIERGWFEVDDPKDLEVAEQSMNVSNN